MSSDGIISGIDENEFGAGTNITRQDMAVLVYRALELKKSELPNTEKDFEEEIELKKTKIHQYNAEISYSQYLKIKEEMEEKKMKKQLVFKSLTYTKEDRVKNGYKISRIFL